MLTPQDLQEVSFEKAKLGGYVMKSVDEFLEPLMGDYVTLYKENAVLKSKMRLLVERLEHYRTNELKWKEALERATQSRGNGIEAFLQDTEKPAQSEKTNEALEAASRALATQTERLRLAKEATADFVSAVETQMARHQQALEALKALTSLDDEAQSGAASSFAAQSPQQGNDSAEDIAAQIEQNVSRITGDSPRPKSESVDRNAATRVLPVLDERTTAKFANLQLGRNYKSGE